MKDVVKHGDVARAWEGWAHENAVKYITDGACKKTGSFYASGLVSVGAALHELRSVLGSWDFLDGTLLDYGCGMGRHALWFARVFTEVIGLDASSEMIRLAKENIRGLDFRVCPDERAIPVADDGVDVFFSFTVFQHNPRENIKTILKEMHRVFRPGGVTVFQLPVTADASKAAYPCDAKHTAVWHLDEFEAAFAPYFEPLRLATDRHFGFHVMEVKK